MTLIARIKNYFSRKRAYTIKHPDLVHSEFVYLKTVLKNLIDYTSEYPNMLLSFDGRLVSKGAFTVDENAGTITINGVQIVSVESLDKMTLSALKVELAGRVKLLENRKITFE